MIVRRGVKILDDRLGSSAFLKRALDKVFPDHWAFMLGEICVYAFIVLLVTGTYIAFWFNDSDARAPYHGGYAPLVGRDVPASYASVLNLSFVVPLGLLVRQMHHWAALVFMGAIVFHMMRIFFTGAFRRPREINWTFGLTLMLLGMAAGFTGYSLPGDLLSGAGLRIAYACAQAVPFVGSWLAFGFFGGRFPTEIMTQRLFITHVWLLPLLIALAMSAHLALVWRQHHTQFAGPRRTEENVVGSRIWPYYAIKSIALLSATFAVIAFLGGFFTINPIWLYGPFDPWTIASPAQPDWYVAWLDGSLRLGPAFAIRMFGHTVSPLFWSAIVVPGVVIGSFFVYPAFERLVTRDDREHHLADMPYDKPWRLGLGVAVVVFCSVIGFAGSDDIQATIFHIPVETLMYAYRMVAVLAPLACGALAVVIGFELRTRFETREGLTHVRRATLRRNAEGGYDEEPQARHPA